SRQSDLGARPPGGLAKARAFDAPTKAFDALAELPTRGKWTKIRADRVQGRGRGAYRRAGGPLLCAGGPPEPVGSSASAAEAPRLPAATLGKKATPSGVSAKAAGRVFSRPYALPARDR